MTALANSFTAVGNGPEISIRKGETVNFHVSGTFVGTVVIEKGSGSNFVEVDSSTAAESGSEVASEDIRYRYRCSAFTSGTIVTNISNAPAVSPGDNVKEAVVVATTADGTFASAFDLASVVDGITLAVGDRILLKDQTSGDENGIYTVNATGAPTRATDADSSDELIDAIIPVTSGTVGADTIWKITNTSAITLETTAITFVQSSVVRVGRQKFINAGTSGKVGTTSGWVVDAADNINLATVPASQSASTLVIPIDGTEVGDVITAFSLTGQIESAGGTVTIDADLRKMTAADGDVADASVQTMTQISVTADDTIEESNSLTSLGTPEVLAEGESLYLLVASTDVALQGAHITFTDTP